MEKSCSFARVVRDDSESPTAARENASLLSHLRDSRAHGIPGKLRADLSLLRVLQCVGDSLSMSTKYGGEEIDSWPADDSHPVVCAGICGFSHRREDLIEHRHTEGCAHLVCRNCLRLHVLAGPHLRLADCKRLERPIMLVEQPNPFGAESC